MLNRIDSRWMVTASSDGFAERTCSVRYNPAMDSKLKIPAEFESAGNAERIEFVQALWDRIAKDQTTVPIPEEHKRILDQRLDAYASDPKAGRAWTDVRDELLAKLRNR